MLTAAFILGCQIGTGAFLRSPDIHGETVVFTCEGDLWLGDLPTRKAQRLTRDVGTESDARFSPDGTQIAFTAEIDGIREIYVIPIRGGAPKRLTYLNEYAETVDWRDSKTVVFRARNYPSATAPTLYAVDVAGGEPKRLPLEFASVASFAPDGNRFAFTRYQRFTNAWFRYQGGLKNPIWTGDLAQLKFSRVHEGAGSCEFPVWLGDRVYFCTNEGGEFLLGSVRTGGGGVRRESSGSPLEFRSLQGDGKRLVYEHGPQIEVFDPQSAQATPIQFEMVSDLLHTRPFTVPAEASVTAASIGPMGRRLLIETRGQIASLPVKEGSVQVLLAKDGVRYRNPVYSPDGKHIAFFTDESGEQQLAVAEANGGNPRTLTTTKGRQLKRIQWAPDSSRIALTTSRRTISIVDLDGTERQIHRGGAWGWDADRFDFSPDGKWIVVSAADLWTGLATLSLIEVATANVTKVGTGIADDFSPQFSADGKYLAFLSRRNLDLRWDPIQNHINLAKDVKVYVLLLSKEVPSPFGVRDSDEGAEEKKEEKWSFRLDVDGLYGRFVEVPLEAGSYDQLDFAGDRLLVRESVSNELRYYDLKAKKAGVLASGAPSFQVSGDGKKVLIANGANLRVIDSTGENDTRVGFAGLQLRIDPVAEWRQMYWDAWRHIRDYFYVENLHGADWPAIGRKYAAYLPAVRSRDELDQLIRWLQAELAISHSFLSAGDVRSLVRPARPAFLGADLEAGEGGFMRIKRIFRGQDFDAGERSPLAEPGLNIREGDYLIEVGGQPAKAGSSWREALLGRAGQAVMIKVNSLPTATGARSVVVRPVANETRMRWWDWVDGRRRYVDEATGGKVAYVYLRAMVLPDMADFIRQYYPQRGKEGLIVDTRFNTGGNVSDQIITVLKQTGMAFWNQRDADIPWTRQSDFFPGPMVCLQNEFNYSDGEEFPFYFKAMKLGPVIGRRTRGGEVGSDPGWPLVDGGEISVPNYGMFTPERGWEIEGKGVEPDIEVLSDPNDWARGRDPQLEKAVAVVLAEMKRRPFKKPTVPPGPIYIRPAGG